MRILLAVLCLVAVAGFACGDDDDDAASTDPTHTPTSSSDATPVERSGEEAEVEAVIRTYFQYYIDAEIEEIYPLLDEASQQGCSEEQFVSFLSGVRGAVGEHEIELLQVASIVIDDDDHATVRTELRFDDRFDDTENTLVKEDGDWKIELRTELCES